MGYNKFRWFTNGKRKKPLPKSSPLLLRIRNGDFEYSPYFDEAKEERAKGKKIYDEYMKTNLISDYTERKKEALQRSKMKRVKALKLEAVGDEEENEAAQQPEHRNARTTEEHQVHDRTTLHVRHKIIRSSRHGDGGGRLDDRSRRPAAQGRRDESRDRRRQEQQHGGRRQHLWRRRRS